MAIKFTYHGATSAPIEIEGLTPDWACDKSNAEIERFQIYDGNRKIALAELFSVAGDASDLHMEFEGDLSGVHWIGAHMQAGRVSVHGPAGRHVGSQMRGGDMVVDGNAGGWVGAEMRRGRIHIRGNAGHLAGAAYRGSAKGMTGGTILVDGNVGNEAGLSMRRGLIAVAGSAGDMLGFNLHAGTIVVAGECGIRPGAGMRRGSLALFGPMRPQLLPSFRFATTFQSAAIGVLLNILQQQRFPLAPAVLSSAMRWDLFHGDLVSLGRGEILFPAYATQ